MLAKPKRKKKKKNKNKEKTSQGGWEGASNLLTKIRESIHESILQLSQASGLEQKIELNFTEDFLGKIQTFAKF